jgi:hypothetical protein
MRTLMLVVAVGRVTLPPNAPPGIYTLTLAAGNATATAQTTGQSGVADSEVPAAFGPAWTPRPGPGAVAIPPGCRRPDS